MNTRRSGTNVASVGQRRPQGPQTPGIAANFVQGGQLKPQQQPVINMPQQQVPKAAPVQGGVQQVQKAPMPVQQGQKAPVPQVGPQKLQQVKQEPQSPVQQKPIIPPTTTTPGVQQKSGIPTPAGIKAETKPPQEAPVRPPVQQQPQVKQQVQAQVQQQQQQQAPPAVVQQLVQQVQEAAASMEVGAEEGVAGEGMEVGGERRGRAPRPWQRGKITKAERVRRRNARFRKVLQPKNALMILNELQGSTQYVFTDLSPKPEAAKVDGGAAVAATPVAGAKTPHPVGFKATTVIEGVEYNGMGIDKVSAKTAAAEAAIKSIILRKIVAGAGTSAAATPAAVTAATAATAGSTGAAVGEDSNGDVAMEEAADTGSVATAAAAAEANGEAEILPWMHIASFALHKLFNSWDEAGTLLRATSTNNLSASLGDLTDGPFGGAGGGTPHAPKESLPVAQRALPDGAPDMHPVMLLNQMRPTTAYNELNVIGQPPAILYNYECVVDGQKFHGTGPNKKVARRNAAFYACQTILGLEYPDSLIQSIQESSLPRKMPPVQPKAPKKGSFGGPQQQRGGGGGGGQMGMMGAGGQQQQQQMGARGMGVGMGGQMAAGVGGGGGMGDQQQQGGGEYDMEQGYQWY